VFNNELY
jgi:hypothetical protein